MGTSPAKKGLPREVNSNITWPDPVKALRGSPDLETKETSGAFRRARPSIDLSTEERSSTVLHPRKIMRDVDISKQMFKKFSAFKKSVDMDTNKAEYKHFLDRMVQEK